MEKMSTRPSLLISTYNNTRLLKACLKSVCCQRVKPFEVIIADDGSMEDTRQMVEELRHELNIPVQYIWQEHKGFRLPVIRNKAIAAAKGNYIIQITGDVVLHRNFIADHIRVAQPGSFICGTRSMLGKNQTRVFFKRHKKRIPFYMRAVNTKSYRISGMCGWLANHFVPRYPEQVEGSNMAFWRDDLLRVNAYNEDLAHFGFEESELATRLVNAGIEQRYLRMGGVQFHLDHPFRVRKAQQEYIRNLELLQDHQLVRCLNGVDKYRKVTETGHTTYIPAFDKAAYL